MPVLCHRDLATDFPPSGGLRVTILSIYLQPRKATRRTETPYMRVFVGRPTNEIQV